MFRADAFKATRVSNMALALQEGAIVVTDSARQKRFSLRTSLWGVVGALLGVAVGRLAASRVLELFGGQPAWIVPVVIIGSVAVCLLIFMLLPLWLRKPEP